MHRKVKTKKTKAENREFLLLIFPCIILYIDTFHQRHGMKEKEKREPFTPKPLVCLQEMDECMFYLHKYIINIFIENGMKKFAYIQSISHTSFR